LFDITQRSANETSAVELASDDEPLYDDKGARLSITVYGPGTKVYQRAQARQQRPPPSRGSRPGPPPPGGRNYRPNCSPSGGAPREAG
jgi:hypothetical protein